MEERTPSTPAISNKRLVANIIGLNGTASKHAKIRPPIPEMCLNRISPNREATPLANGVSGFEPNHDLPSPKICAKPTSPMISKKSVPNRGGTNETNGKPFHHRSTPNLLHNKIAPITPTVASSPSFDDSLSPTKSEGKTFFDL